jgi:hypothetical protein
MLVQVFLLEEEDGAAKWGLAVSGREEKRAYPFGEIPNGPWAESGSGQFGFPAAILSLFLFFYFSFSDFRFISYLLQIRFKPIQTTS